MPLARHDILFTNMVNSSEVSTHMPLARHDGEKHLYIFGKSIVSTHMPLARHDPLFSLTIPVFVVSTHMPLARHDAYSATANKKLEFLLTCLLRGMTRCYR